jgi:hypothetical protein
MEGPIGVIHSRVRIKDSRNPAGDTGSGDIDDGPTGRRCARRKVF